MLRPYQHMTAGMLTVCCWLMSVAAIDCRGADPPAARHAPAEVAIPSWVKTGTAASTVESALSIRFDREGLRDILTDGELLERMGWLKELEQFQEAAEALRNPEAGESSTGAETHQAVRSPERSGGASRSPRDGLFGDGFCR